MMIKKKTTFSVTSVPQKYFQICPYCNINHKVSLSSNNVFGSLCLTVFIGKVSVISGGNSQTILRWGGNKLLKRESPLPPQTEERCSTFPVSRILQRKTVQRLYVPFLTQRLNGVPTCHRMRGDDAQTEEFIKKQSMVKHRGKGVNRHLIISQRLILNPTLRKIQYGAVMTKSHWCVETQPLLQSPFNQTITFN